MENQKENKRYVASMEMWFRGQKCIISGLEITVDNAEVMIDHFKAVKKNDSKQLMHEKKYLSGCIENFIDWCNQKKIEVPEWAK